MFIKYYEKKYYQQCVKKRVQKQEKNVLLFKKLKNPLGKERKYNKYLIEDQKLIKLPK